MLKCGRFTLSSTSPLVMGIVNVTPDSFSDGGRYLTAERAIEHGLRLKEEGAHILDIGGESTRPGSAAGQREAGIGGYCRCWKACAMPARPFRWTP
jgi:dihydropteroate synthase